MYTSGTLTAHQEDSYRSPRIHQTVACGNRQWQWRKKAVNAHRPTIRVPAALAAEEAIADHRSTKHMPEAAPARAALG
jgi:hypothetical protein